MLRHGISVASSHREGDILTSVDYASPDLCVTGYSDGKIAFNVLEGNRASDYRVRSHCLLRITPEDEADTSLRSAVTCLCISPCLCFLAIGTSVGTVTVLDLRSNLESWSHRLENHKTFKLLYTHKEHRGGRITALKWSIHSRSYKLFSGCTNGDVIELFVCNILENENRIRSSASSTQETLSSLASSFIQTLTTPAVYDTKYDDERSFYKHGSDNKDFLALVYHCRYPVMQIECSATESSRVGMMDILVVTAGDTGPSGGYEAFLFHFPWNQSYNPRCRELYSTQKSTAESKTSGGSVHAETAKDGGCGFLFLNSESGSNNGDTLATGILAVYGYGSDTLSLRAQLHDTDGNTSSLFTLERIQALPEGKKHPQGAWQCRQCVSLYKHVAVVLSDEGRAFALNLQERFYFEVDPTLHPSCSVSSLHSSSSDGKLVLLMDHHSMGVVVSTYQSLSPGATCRPCPLLNSSVARSLALLQTRWRERRRGDESYGAHSAAYNNTAAGKSRVGLANTVAQWGVPGSTLLHDVRKRKERVDENTAMLKQVDTLGDHIDSRIHATLHVYEDTDASVSIERLGNGIDEGGYKNKEAEQECVQALPCLAEDKSADSNREQLLIALASSSIAVNSNNASSWRDEEDLCKQAEDLISITLQLDAAGDDEPIKLDMWPFQSFAGDKSDILHHSSSFDTSVEGASAGFTMLPTSEHSYDALQFAEQSLQRLRESSRVSCSNAGGGTEIYLGSGRAESCTVLVKDGYPILALRHDLDDDVDDNFFPRPGDWSSVVSCSNNSEKFSEVVDEWCTFAPIDLNGERETNTDLELECCLRENHDSWIEQWWGCPDDKSGLTDAPLTHMSSGRNINADAFFNDSLGSNSTWSVVPEFAGLTVRGRLRKRRSRSSERRTVVELLDESLMFSAKDSILNDSRLENSKILPRKEVMTAICCYQLPANTFAQEMSVPEGEDIGMNLVLESSSYQHCSHGHNLTATQVRVVGFIPHSDGSPGLLESLASVHPGDLLTGLRLPRHVWEDEFVDFSDFSVEEILKVLQLTMGQEIMLFFQYGSAVEHSGASVYSLEERHGEQGSKEGFCQDGSESENDSNNDIFVAVSSEEDLYESDEIDEPDKVGFDDNCGDGVRHQRWLGTDWAAEQNSLGDMNDYDGAPGFVYDQGAVQSAEYPAIVKSNPHIQHVQERSSIIGAMEGVLPLGNAVQASMEPLSRLSAAIGKQFREDFPHFHGELEDHIPKTSLLAPSRPFIDSIGVLYDSSMPSTAVFYGYTHGNDAHVAELIRNGGSDISVPYAMAGAAVAAGGKLLPKAVKSKGSTVVDVIVDSSTELATTMLKGNVGLQMTTDVVSAAREVASAAWSAPFLKAPPLKSVHESLLFELVADHDENFKDSRSGDLKSSGIKETYNSRNVQSGIVNNDYSLTIYMQRRKEEEREARRRELQLSVLRFSSCFEQPISEDHAIFALAEHCWEVYLIDRVPIRACEANVSSRYPAITANFTVAAKEAARPDLAWLGSQGFYRPDGKHLRFSRAISSIPVRPRSLLSIVSMSQRGTRIRKGAAAVQRQRLERRRLKRNRRRIARQASMLIHELRGLAIGHKEKQGLSLALSSSASRRWRPSTFDKGEADGECEPRLLFRPRRTRFRKELQAQAIYHQLYNCAHDYGSVMDCSDDDDKDDNIARAKDTPSLKLVPFSDPTLPHRAAAIRSLLSRSPSTKWDNRAGQDGTLEASGIIYGTASLEALLARLDQRVRRLCEERKRSVREKGEGRNEDLRQRNSSLVPFLPPKDITLQLCTIITAMLRSSRCVRAITYRPHPAGSPSIPSLLRLWLQLFTPIPPQYKDRLSAKQLLVASSLVSLGFDSFQGLRDYTECVVDLTTLAYFVGADLPGPRTECGNESDEKTARATLCIHIDGCARCDPQHESRFCVLPLALNLSSPERGVNYRALDSSKNSMFLYTYAAYMHLDLVAASSNILLQRATTSEISAVYEAQLKVCVELDMLSDLAAEHSANVIDICSLKTKSKADFVYKIFRSSPQSPTPAHTPLGGFCLLRTHMKTLLTKNSYMASYFMASMWPFLSPKNIQEFLTSISSTMTSGENCKEELGLKFSETEAAMWTARMFIKYLHTLFSSRLLPSKSDRDSQYSDIIAMIKKSDHVEILSTFSSAMAKIDPGALQSNDKTAQEAMDLKTGIVFLCSRLLIQCRSEEFRGLLYLTTQQLGSNLLCLIKGMLQIRGTFDNIFFGQVARLIRYCHSSSVSTTDAICETLNSVSEKEDDILGGYENDIGMCLVRALGWDLTKNIIGRVPALKNHLGLKFYRNALRNGSWNTGVDDW